MSGTLRTYLRRREDGSWFRVVTDGGDPARVLDYGPVPESEVLALLKDGETEHVAERRKD